MRFKRSEFFRYDFGQPIPCEIIILNENQRALSNKRAKAEILDLSLNGLKFLSALDLPYNQKHIQLKFIVRLNEKPLILYGKIAWKKSIAADYIYGVKLETNESTKKELMEELKFYAKTHLRS